MSDEDIEYYRTQWCDWVQRQAEDLALGVCQLTLSSEWWDLLDEGLYDDLVPLLRKVKHLKILGDKHVPRDIDLTPFSSLVSLELITCPVLQLKNLKDIVGQLEVLRCVNSASTLHELLVRSLGEGTKGKTWSSLTHLTVKECRLTALDASIQLAPALVSLDLSNNELVRVNQLVFCVKLDLINLSYNRITSIEPLTHLTHLKTVFLQNNAIKTVRGLELCEKLETLDVAYNSIESLDEFENIFGLAELMSVSLAENPISNNSKSLDKIIDMCSTRPQVAVDVLSQRLRGRTPTPSMHTFSPSNGSASNPSSPFSSFDSTYKAPLSSPSGSFIDSTGKRKVTKGKKKRTVMIEEADPSESIHDDVTSELRRAGSGLGSFVRPPLEKKTSEILEKRKTTLERKPSDLRSESSRSTVQEREDFSRIAQPLLISSPETKRKTDKSSTDSAASSWEAASTVSNGPANVVRTSMESRDVNGVMNTLESGSSVRKFSVDSTDSFVGKPKSGSAKKKKKKKGKDSTAAKSKKEEKVSSRKTSQDAKEKESEEAFLEFSTKPVLFQQHIEYIQQEAGDRWLSVLDEFQKDPSIMEKKFASPPMSPRLTPKSNRSSGRVTPRQDHLESMELLIRESGPEFERANSALNTLSRAGSHQSSPSNKVSNNNISYDRSNSDRYIGAGQNGSEIIEKKSAPDFRAPSPSSSSLLSSSSISELKQTNRARIASKDSSNYEPLSSFLSSPSHDSVSSPPPLPSQQSPQRVPDSPVLSSSNRLATIPSVSMESSTLLTYSPDSTRDRFITDDSELNLDLSRSAELQDMLNSIDLMVRVQLLDGSLEERILSVSANEMIELDAAWGRQVSKRDLSHLTSVQCSTIRDASGNLSPVLRLHFRFARSDLATGAYYLEEPTDSENVQEFVKTLQQHLDGNNSPNGSAGSGNQSKTPVKRAGQEVIISDYFSPTKQSQQQQNNKQNKQNKQNGSSGENENRNVTQENRKEEEEHGDFNSALEQRIASLVPVMTVEAPQLLEFMSDEHLWNYFQNQVFRSGRVGFEEETFLHYCRVGSLFCSEGKEKEIPVLLILTTRHIYILENALTKATSQERPVFPILSCHTLEDINKIVVGFAGQRFRISLRTQEGYWFFPRDKAVTLTICSKLVSAAGCELTNDDIETLEAIQRYVLEDPSDTVRLYVLLYQRLRPDLSAFEKLHSYKLQMSIPLAPRALILSNTHAFLCREYWTGNNRDQPFYQVVAKHPILSTTHIEQGEVVESFALVFDGPSSSLSASSSSSSSSSLYETRSYERNTNKKYMKTRGNRPRAVSGNDRVIWHLLAQTAAGKEKLSAELQTLTQRRTVSLGESSSTPTRSQDDSVVNRDRGQQFLTNEINYKNFYSSNI